MHTHTYWAYGLRICAELPCPGLLTLTDDDAPADVTVEILPEVSESLEELEHRFFEVRPGLFQLHIPEVARYEVEDGRRIGIRPLPGATEDQMRLFLLGSAMGALLYQRGLFPLHGCAVETPWGGMVFVGPQGIGKSTLAAEFSRRGYRLLSDDVCALRMEGQRIEILPALSQVRLCPDAFERLQGEREGRFEIDKYVVAMGEGYCPHPVELRAVHVLAELDGETGPRYEPVQGLAQVRSLVENLYRPQYLMGQSTQGELVRLAASIAQQTEMGVVGRRRDAARLGNLVEFLEAQWAERYAAPVEERTAWAV